MAKKSSSVSKKYLKILGIVEIVFAVILAALTVFAVTLNPTLTDLGFTADQIANMTGSGITESAIKTIFYVTTFICIAIAILIGALLIRAANNPKKSTFVLVLTVLSTVGAVITLFSSGFSNIGSVITNAITLTLDILTLMALVKIRGEIKE